MKDFEKEIELLVTGNVAEITVEKNDFDDFRIVWMNHRERKNIVGIAGLNGTVIYKYFPKNSE